MNYESPNSAGLLTRWSPAVLVFAMFLAYSAIQAPVPSVNEPQYLGKAKHFWDPSWCEGDFFLNTSNPHLVFYVAVGWLTRFMSLEAAAWISRIAGYAVVAWGWTLLAGRLTPSHWYGIPAAGIFLLLASIGNLSGEWLVGGIEGKIFAYGLLLAAIALRLGGSTIAAAACLGGSVSFHPIVGLWGLGCGLIAELLAAWRTNRLVFRPTRDAARTLLVFAAISLPGVIPALATLDGASSVDAARATYMQVFIRLRHHLDPTQFSAARYAGYGLMLASWTALLFTLCRREPDASRRTSLWFATFVLTSVVIALAGVIVGWHWGDAWTMPLRDLRGTLLKFYPFRLADVFIPLALSMSLAAWLGRLRGAAWLAGIITVTSLAASLGIASPDRNPSRMPPDQLAAWTEVARWVRDETPGDTVIMSPSRQWGFRWYSERALYVNYKDAPQDVAGLIEWERRLAVVKDWWESTDGTFDNTDLRHLGELTGAGYLVTRATTRRFDSEPVFENSHYRVYQLP